MEEKYENYKLIAEFMGYKSDINYPEKLAYSFKYDKDWNSLISVINKIESLPEVDETLIRYDSVNQTYPVEIMSAYKDFPNIKIFGRKSRIKAVYNAVVSFIKEYNSEGEKHE